MADGQEHGSRGLTEQQLAYHLRAVVESSDDAVVSKDLNGIVQSWNPAAEQIFGYSAEEMIGQSIRRIIPADLQAEEDEVLRRVRIGDRVDHFETVRQRKDGSRVQISLTVSPVRDDLGNIIGASKIARDISERHAAEEALRASVELKDQFLKLVSHELRTPVATVVGNAQLLLRRAGQLTDHDQREALTDVASEALRLERIVEDLLALTRLPPGDRVPLAPVDLEEVVRDVLRARERIVEGRRYPLQVVPAVPLAAADDSLVRLVLGNLLANAEKYSPDGSAIEVCLRASDEGGPEVHVLDRGPGVERGEVERIFDPFYRGSTTSREAPGMGLGLAVCQRAMDAQCGWIRFEPRSGGGSAFKFGLSAPGAASPASFTAASMGAGSGPLDHR